jgi:hypothetical protein
MDTGKFVEALSYGERLELLKKLTEWKKGEDAFELSVVEANKLVLDKWSSGEMGKDLRDILAKHFSRCRLTTNDLDDLTNNDLKRIRGIGEVKVEEYNKYRYSLMMKKLEKLK